MLSLPLELRQIIWRYSLPDRRAVEVFYDETVECISPCALPAALHVSSEARGVAFDSYELLFVTRKANAKIYFDVSVDALFLGVGNFSPSSEKPARTRPPSTLTYTQRTFLVHTPRSREALFYQR